MTTTDAYQAYEDRTLVPLPVVPGKPLHLIATIHQAATLWPPPAPPVLSTYLRAWGVITSTATAYPLANSANFTPAPPDQNDIDLSPYLTATYSPSTDTGPDVVVVLLLPGALTRQIVTNSLYDIRVSLADDLDEEKAIRLAYGSLFVQPSYAPPPPA